MSAMSDESGQRTEETRSSEEDSGAVFWALAAIGWTAIGVGLFGVLDHPGTANAFKVFRLLVGLNVVNDAVVIPTLILLAFVVRRLAPRWLIMPMQVWFIMAGAVTVYAYPMVGDFGRSKANPSILPHNYAHNLLIVLGCITAFSALLGLAVLASSTFDAGVNDTARVRGRTLLVSRGLVVVISLAPTLVYLFVALHRIGYPYELEWLEGGAVEIAGRVAHGQAIYVAPSIHYVPYPYTPLYFWITGTLARVTGVGFLPLRLVSLLSSLGACALLVRIVWRETGDVVAGVVASGLFTATFVVSGAWLDIGRVDSLALFLLLAAVYRGRHAQGISGGIVVGLLAFLAFMTKQSALVAMAPVLVVLLVCRRRVGVPALATVAVLVVGSTYLLDASSHGWYGYYAFQELLDQGEVSQCGGRFSPRTSGTPLGPSVWGWLPWPCACCTGGRRVDRLAVLGLGHCGAAPVIPGVEAAFGRRAERADPGLCGHSAHGCVRL